MVLFHNIPFLVLCIAQNVHLVDVRLMMFLGICRCAHTRYSQTVMQSTCGFRFIQISYGVFQSMLLVGNLFSVQTAY